MYFVDCTNTQAGGSYVVAPVNLTSHQVLDLRPGSLLLGTTDIHRVRGHHTTAS